MFLPVVDWEFVGGASVAIKQDVVEAAVPAKANGGKQVARELALRRGVDLPGRHEPTIDAAGDIERTIGRHF